MPPTGLFFSSGVNPCDVITSVQTLLAALLSRHCYVIDSPVVTCPSYVFGCLALPAC